MREKNLSEKHGCEDTSLSFHDRLCAIQNDASLSEDQRLAALLGISDIDWVATQEPPLFVAALSLDSPEEKAAAVEAALRAGADPNELDHHVGRNNRGRALSFFLDVDAHYEINGNLDGLVNNLPAIEVMLRYGADPRLRAPWFGPRSPLACVSSAMRRECAPEFFEKAWRMMDEVAGMLEG